MSNSTFEASFEDSAALGAADEIARSPWVVLKFGGTSVSTAESWATIAQIVQNRIDAGLQPLIVHSALKGVSNTLESVLEHAVAGSSSTLLEELRTQHFTLAEELGLDGKALLGDTLHELEQLVAGARLVREVSVRVRVRIMALGELMSTRLGAQYLNARGIATEWADARELLTSETRGGRRDERSYLSATCGFDANDELAARLKSFGKVVLTQGFIARNDRGETVLLGRGGSDTSAA